LDDDIERERERERERELAKEAQELKIYLG
jgi:hypothetical protein